MRPACNLPEPPPKKTAPTPSTLLLSRPQREFFELKPTTNALDPRLNSRLNSKPLRPLRPHPVCLSEEFLSWPGLLLERTDRAWNQNTRIFLVSPNVGSPEANNGELNETTKEAPDNCPNTRPSQCRTTGLMRSERPSQDLISQELPNHDSLRVGRAKSS